MLQLSSTLLKPAVPNRANQGIIEPEISEPVDILAATKFFLQVTGGGDV